MVKKNVVYILNPVLIFNQCSNPFYTWMTSHQFINQTKMHSYYHNLSNKRK